jgi:glutamine amidotransferase
MSTLIGVIDYGMGNRRSVQKALEHVGAHVAVTAELGVLSRCDGLVLPGVGAFPAAMRELQARGLGALIRACVRDRVPLLGICLGMQLLFERSDEVAPTAGLGLLPGHVRQLRSGGLRLPHIGWNEVRFERPCALTAALPSGGCPFYHVHSFVACPDERAQVVGTTEYGERFATIVAGQGVFGAQFHPEKSSADGLAFLGAFVALCAGVSTGPAAAHA